MSLNNVDYGIKVFYALNNSIIPGNFESIPSDAFYARIVQRLPFININGYFDVCEVSFTIFIGKYNSDLKKIEVISVNDDGEYSLYFNKDNNDIVCDSRESFVEQILRFKFNYDNLQEQIYTSKKLELSI